MFDHFFFIVAVTEIPIALNIIEHVYEKPSLYRHVPKETDDNVSFGEEH